MVCFKKNILSEMLWNLKWKYSKAYYKLFISLDSKHIDYTFIFIIQSKVINFCPVINFKIVQIQYLRHSQRLCVGIK